ncbi:MAG: hypothetical protein KGM94_19705 [Bradyrhizobium sp.]|nr:hypothetical protein [Bradyrhizobium sp.]MDE2379503.1 hypothetical protein [Bradyrhizobium sp.]
MLAGLKAAPLLNGFRGAAKVDVGVLAQLIAAISMLAARHAQGIVEVCARREPLPTLSATFSHKGRRKKVITAP